MTDLSPTDWRALCAELVEKYDLEWRARERIKTALAQPEPQGPSDKELHQLWQELYIFHDGPTSGDVAEIARAVLARWGCPAIEPVDDRIAELEAELEAERLRLAACGVVAMADTPESASKARDIHMDYWSASLGDVIRQVDALMALRSAIEPVPVAERLPGPEDCDAEGRCWLLTVEDDYPQWRLHSIQGAQPGGYMIWVPVDSDGAMVDCFYTSHWLPAHALPVPQQEAE